MGLLWKRILQTAQSPYSALFVRRPGLTNFKIRAGYLRLKDSETICRNFFGQSLARIAVSESKKMEDALTWPALSVNTNSAGIVWGLTLDTGTLTAKKSFVPSS